MLEAPKVALSLLNTFHQNKSTKTHFTRYEVRYVDNKVFLKSGFKSLKIFVSDYCLKLKTLLFRNRT